ncbi:MAG: hypothetical protein LBQ15_10960 [Clostridium sp.]|jgi:hypothetical protein|nr:hypothetical protein [Clostridium sp.]
MRPKKQSVKERRSFQKNPDLPESRLSGENGRLLDFNRRIRKLLAQNAEFRRWNLKPTAAAARNGENREELLRTLWNRLEDLTARPDSAPAEMEATLNLITKLQEAADSGYFNAQRALKRFEGRYQQFRYEEGFLGRRLTLFSANILKLADYAPENYVRRPDGSFRSILRLTQPALKEAKAYRVWKYPFLTGSALAMAFAATVTFGGISTISEDGNGFFQIASGNLSEYEEDVIILLPQARKQFRYESLEEVPKPYAPYLWDPAGLPEGLSVSHVELLQQGMTTDIIEQFSSADSASALRIQATHYATSSPVVASALFPGHDFLERVEQGGTAMDVYEKTEKGRTEYLIYYTDPVTQYRISGELELAAMLRIAAAYQEQTTAGQNATAGQEMTALNTPARSCGR